MEMCVWRLLVCRHNYYMFVFKACRICYIFVFEAYDSLQTLPLNNLSLLSFSCWSSIRLEASGAATPENNTSCGSLVEA